MNARGASAAVGPNESEAPNDAGGGIADICPADHRAAMEF